MIGYRNSFLFKIFGLFLFGVFLISLGFLNQTVFAVELTENNLTVVGALDAEHEDPFAQNNISFYDPNECDTTTTYSGSCTSVSGSEITWIGDSYSVGAKDLIEGAFPGVDLGGSINDSSSNIMTSKLFAGSVSSNPTGIEILRKKKNDGSLRPIVVFALGTNGGYGVTEGTASGWIEEVLNIIGGDTKVIFVNARTGKNNNYSGFNDALEAAKKAYPEQVYVADWAGVADDSMFSQDTAMHVHPTGHYDVWLDAIKKVMPKTCSNGVGLMNGDGNAYVVWNYMVEKYAPVYNFTPEILAGLMGNFEAESGFNPFAKNNTMLGLYQTNNTNFKSYIEGKFGSHWGGKASSDMAADVLEAEIDFLMDESLGYNWNANSEATKFTNLLDLPTNKSGEAGAAAYSDLFLATFEKAVGGSAALTDPAVAQKFPRLYQHADRRRDNAKKWYNEYLQNGGAQVVVSKEINSGVSGGASSGGFVWQDGWLISGMPGWTKEDVTNKKLSETLRPGYTTPDGKPNKILLHSTEGTTIGFAAYPSNNKFPAHFIIDLKKKQVVQNLPITNRALATASADGSSVQIEIVGFSTPSFIPKKEYYLQSFSTDDWDYLALLLVAISQETGIPLTTELDWDINYSNASAVRYKGKTEFNNNVKGIAGHMHASSPDTHVDPGPIWGFLQEALNRNPSAASFSNTSTASGTCEECKTYNGGYSSGGLDDTQVGQMVEWYKSDKVTNSEWQLPSKYGKWNCVSFSAWFFQAFTTVGKRSGPWTIDSGAGTMAHKLAGEYNLVESNTPKPFSIYSVTKGVTMCGDHKCGHTGVVVAVNGDDIVTIEAAYGKVGYTAKVVRKLDYFVNSKYGATFVDLSPIMDMNKLQEFFNGSTIDVSSGGVASSCGMATEAAVLGDDAKCDSRTIELGVAEDAYKAGQNIPIMLCAIPNITETHTKEPWEDKYVLSGKDTNHIHVNASVSTAFYELGEKYKASHNGKTLSASESYRTMARQEYFYNCYKCKCCNNGNTAAAPGKSNHQFGQAVDFVGEYNWLGQNVGSVGLKQGTAIREPWHISLSGR